MLVESSNSNLPESSLPPTAKEISQTIKKQVARKSFVCELF
jgi:hypothetical protein